MVLLPLLILSYKGSILLLNLGIVRPHPTDVINQKRCLSPHCKDLYILDVFANVGCEVSLHQVALLDHLQVLCQLLLSALEHAGRTELFNSNKANSQTLDHICSCFHLKGEDFDSQIG